jgi:dTDP-4-dehydrorhamnose reductase
MNILVSGSNSRVGLDFKRFKEFDIKNNYFLYNKHELDITDLNVCKNIVNEIKPDIIINFSAITNADYAEKNKIETLLVNTIGPLNLIANQNNIKICNISSAYVYGYKDLPHSEEDIKNPQNFYGKTKLLNEKLITSITNKHFLIRTNFLFGSKDKSDFIKSTIKKIKNNEKIKAVSDQVASFTFIPDLNDAIFNMINTESFGVYNISNNGYYSFYDICLKIKHILKSESEIIPISIDSLDSVGTRLKNYCLDNNKFEERFYKIRTIDDLLEDYVWGLKND